MDKMEELRRAIFVLTSPSNTPKIGERILGAHVTLISRSNCAQMEKIALYGRIVF